MFRIVGKQSNFRQWDLNQLVTCDCLKEGDDVVFRSYGKTYETTAFVQDGMVVADVPNFILQKAGSVRVDLGWGLECHLDCRTTFDVEAREKPEDYVCTENIKQRSSGLISILDADPLEPKEGQMWILKTATEELTTPVIELGEVSENSIAFKLCNASFDGKGAVVASYNIYVNGELNKTENIEPGGTCVVTDLSADTEYQISVCGVNGKVLSEMSNVLQATTHEYICVYTADEGDCVAVYAAWPTFENGKIVLASSSAARAVILSLTGDKAYINNDDIQGTYYPLAIPVNATSVTVECPSDTQYSFNGYTVTDGKYERTIDSGFKPAGETFIFDAGKCQYCYIYTKKTSGEFTEGDLAGTKITFA